MLIAIKHEHRHELVRRASELDQELVHVKSFPHYRYALIRGGAVDGLQDLPFITLSGSPSIGWRGVLKRALDLGIAVPLFIALLPLMAALWLTIRLSSKGPGLFRQKRVGLQGSKFTLVKFRTMRADAERETGPVWAKNNDPRCTRIGIFLRKTSLDELPQLWNVICGEMSLVGPRPERPVFVAQFRDTLPKYMLRHTVKVGMTGWAQVRGWRGNTSVHKRLEHDLWYIENWSPLLDLKVLGLTVAGGFLNRNH